MGRCILKKKKLDTRFARQLWGECKWYDYPINWLEELWHKIKPYRILNYLKNFKKFNIMAWNYRRWDSTFSIEVFCQLLEDNAKACRDGGSFDARKDYRRGMAMAGYLRKAYLEYYTYPSVRYLLDKNPIKIKNYRLTHDYITDEKLFDKMYSLAIKKQREIEQQRKKEAWAYVNKYIEHLWN